MVAGYLADPAAAQEALDAGVRELLDAAGPQGRIAST
jgi:hypothetical protein